MTAEKVPSSPAVRVEIRIAGKIKFANMCYEPAIENDEKTGTVSFTASLTPNLVDAPKPVPKEKFGTDPRDGDSVIQKVHFGSRTTT